MRLDIAKPRVLPAAIVAMALLLAVKSIALVQAATGGGSAAAAGAPPAPPAKPGAAPAMAPAPAMPMAAKPDDGTVQAAPTVSTAERALLLDLRRRRDGLDARARELDQRDAVVAAAEQKIAARVAELNALQAKLQALENDRHAHDDANWTGLVHVYEAMKPREAATIFDALDMQVLLAVLDRMQTRKAAPILAAMQPDRARLATQLLAELRTKTVTPAGEKPTQPSPKG